LAAGVSMKRLIAFICWSFLMGAPDLWAFQDAGGYSPAPVPFLPIHTNSVQAIPKLGVDSLAPVNPVSLSEQEVLHPAGCSQAKRDIRVCQCADCCAGQSGHGRRWGSRGEPRYLSLDVGWGAVDAHAEVLSMGQVVPPALELDSAFLTRIGIGKHLGNWRMEGEVGLRQMNVDDVKLFYDEYHLAQGQRNATSLMVNLFYDLKIPGIVTPYGKCGLGTSFNEVEGSLFVNSLGTNIFVGDVYPASESWEFAWSLGGGLGVCLTRALFLDLEYQYIDLGGASTEYNSVGSALGLGRGWSHEFTAGLRVNF